MIVRPVNAPDLFLVDGLNLVFKQYHGFKREDGAALTAGGMETFVLFGFLRSLRALLEVFVPHTTVIVWEGRGGKKRRKDLYPEYKDGRAEMTKEELASLFGQVGFIREFMYYLGLGSLAVPRYEADDVLYALARHASAQGLTSVTATSDKDLLQVVHSGDHRASWYDGTKNLLVNSKTFTREVGVTPERYVDYKCLIKDESDNLDGVTGIGKKTAVKLLSDGSLAEFMAGPVPKTKREGILFTPEGVKQVELMKKLVDLEYFRTPELDAEIVRCIEVGTYDEAELRELMEDFAFFSLLETFGEFLNPYRASGELREVVTKL